MGRPAVFLRLAGCNLACAWCDTPYTWDWQRYDPREQVHMRDSAEVIAHVRKLVTPNSMLVITGGEPLLQQAAIPPLLVALDPFISRVEVETNGTIVPSADLAAAVDQFNVSPKLDHAGNTAADYNPEALRAFAALKQAVFKFVVEQSSDLAAVDEYTTTLSVAPSRVWIMPEGTNAAVLNQRLLSVLPAALERGYNVAHRLHILLWGNTRGV